MPDAIAYKVLGSEELEAVLSGSWPGSAVDRQDGFVHLSTAAQLTETVDKHFSGRTGLIVAAIDLGALGDKVRWEPSRGGQLFPHVYAPLPGGAVIAHCPLDRDSGGEVKRPA